MGEDFSASRHALPVWDRDIVRDGRDAWGRPVGGDVPLTVVRAGVGLCDCLAREHGRERNRGRHQKSELGRLVVDAEGLRVAIPAVEFAIGIGGRRSGRGGADIGPEG